MMQAEGRAEEQLEPANKLAPADRKDAANNSAQHDQQTSSSGGLYSDQQNIDAECEKLLRNTKKQVKQMMEEAVTKKFIHEESSSIMALCVAVDACLSHGLKRRALGLFKTSSSTALIQKVSKSCKSAQEVLDVVEAEERKTLSEQQSNATRPNGNSQQQTDKSNGNKSVQRSPLKQVASNLSVHKRNKWIKVALIDKKLVSILEHLAENANKYYEPEALMANYLCAQILSSLLVGPSALEFSRSKTNDCYQFEDPTADELLKRHKLANPIACLCNNSGSRHLTNLQRSDQLQQHQQQHVEPHSKLSRSATDNIRRSTGARPQCRQTNSYSLSPVARTNLTNDTHSKMHASDESNLNSQCSRDIQAADQPRRLPSPSRGNQLRGDSRRRPLALKTNAKRGTLVTDCHHYSCQEISEHNQTRGYTFLCTSASITGASNPFSGPSGASGCAGHHQDWSPRMLHETLHQNSKSSLLYAKNNVLLETQPNDYMAGYLSLHQTSSDLILKWIPNQMINGSQQQAGSCSVQCDPQPRAGKQNDKTNDFEENMIPTPSAGLSDPTATAGGEQSTAVESSYLDLVVSLSVSRIVLLHCQFRAKYNFSMLASEQQQGPTKFDEEQTLENQTPEQNHVDGGDRAGCQQAEAGCNSATRRPQTEETLILVEADGVQMAPFKFPKGGLRLFLSCLESGLRPDKYLDPAVKFDDGCLDPLRSPLSSADSLGLDSPTTDASPSRLDSILRRLPSLKRRAQPTDKGPDSRAKSPELSSNQPEMRPPQTPYTSDNYVYRIVSTNQPGWPLQTPPHSAISLPSASSSNGSPNQLTARQQQQATGSTSSSQGSAQKFRWSLTRLAKFSARYTNSGSTASTTSMPNGTLNNTSQNNGYGESISSGSVVSYNQQATLEGSNSICGDNNDLPSEAAPNDIQNKPKRDNSSELARIEAKLDDLKKSTSEEILALRTQSIQTLCESMRKQIVARAFYGWLAHCRKVRIIRAHLVGLIHPDDRCFLIEQDEALARAGGGLTQERFDELLRNEQDLGEEQLRVQVNQLVYYGGVASDELRREVWPYLLGHYRFTDDSDQRLARDKQARDSYESCGRDWIKIERVVKQRDHEILTANMAKASREAAGRTISETSTDSLLISNSNDNRSTDNNNNDNSDINEDDHENEDSVDDQAAGGGISLGVNTEAPTEGDSLDPEAGTTGEQRQEPHEEMKRRNSSNTTNTRMRKAKDSKLAAKRRRRRRHRLESTGSVGSDASITDQYGNNIHRIDKDVQRCDRNFWYFKDTKNLEKLRNIMCTYVWKHLDIGYVQGMCDLAAPFLVIFDDEIMAYNCFSQLMKRMESNFPHGSAMDQHFESLKHLIQILDPKLFDILQSNGDYTHFYFCYRWLLLDFKRELAYEDVYKVWETIWSARVVVTDHFVVFMALAMVRYYRDIIIENNMDFTDTIKFFNEMAERHDAKGITALARDCIVELISLIKTMEL